MNARLLTARELGEYLGLSSASVLRRWRAGEIPGFVLSSNVVRFDQAEIDHWRKPSPEVRYSEPASSSRRLKEIRMPAEQRGSAYRTRTGWGVRWYEENGRRRFRSGFGSKTAAIAYFRQEVAPPALGSGLDLI